MQSNNNLKSMLHLEIIEYGLNQCKNYVVPVQNVYVSGNLRFKWKARFSSYKKYSITYFQDNQNVNTLQSFTAVTAAASVSCFEELWGSRAFFRLSINCFFLQWRGEQGAPASAFTISSNIFCTNINYLIITVLQKTLMCWIMNHFLPEKEQEA